MPNLDNLIKTVASLSSTPTKVFVPEVGHRIVTKTADDHILDSGGKDLTSSFSLPAPEQEVVEDHQRQDIGELSANQAVNSIQFTNLGLQRTMTALKSLQDLKQMLLGDLDTDPKTLQALETMETYINQLNEKYLVRKEDLRNHFK